MNLLLPPQGTYDFTERKDTRIGIKLLNPGRKRRGGEKEKRVDLVGLDCQRSVERRVQGRRKEGTAPRGGPCYRGQPDTLGSSPRRRNREPPPRTRGLNARRARPGVEKRNKTEKKKKTKKNPKPYVRGELAVFFWTRCKAGLPGRKSQTGPETELFFSRWARKQRRRRFSHARLKNLIPKGANLISEGARYRQRSLPRCRGPALTG